VEPIATPNILSAQPESSRNFARHISAGGVTNTGDAVYRRNNRSPPNPIEMVSTNTMAAIALISGDRPENSLP